MSSYISNPITTASTNVKITQDNCRKYVATYPSFTPIIYTLSVTESMPGQYSLVYIFGENFFPSGTTYVNFGSFTNIPITFYSSNNISFVVPINAGKGTYNVVVVNIYNGNFSPPVKYSYPGILNYSNAVPYFLRHFSINGTYYITSNSTYKYIITFTGNSTIQIYSSFEIIYMVVGGGGGGFINAELSNIANGGGGGGGGQVLTGIFTTGMNKNYFINIGQGGLGGNIQLLPATSGEPSSFTGYNISQIANGGDHGYLNGGNSGGGGLGGLGGLIPPGNGINGGGGGGGQYSGGNGGNGGVNIINANYGGGGGGGGGEPFGNGGLGFGGGGNGGNSSGTIILPENGKENTGGGGGGGTLIYNNFINGGNGGSGVVILYFN